jgi:hypothetical protein
VSLSNPMGISGPGWTSNYAQPNVANPSVNANVASYPVGANVLSLTWPIPVYTQPNNPTNVTATQLDGGALGISNNP